MSINEKIKSNPELIEANVIVGDALNSLIERKWGSVTAVFTAQKGRITTMKIHEEKVFKISGNEFESKD